MKSRFAPRSVPGFEKGRHPRQAFSVMLASDEAMEFLPPRIVEDPLPPSPSINRDQFVQQAPTLEGNTFSNDPSPGDLPPLETSPRSSTSSKSTRQNAIPLDGALRDDQEAESDDDKTYPSGRDSFGWIAGTQDKFGMLEWEMEPLSRVQYRMTDDPKSTQLHFDSTFGARWLQGPVSTDLPAYLFNILINVGITQRITDKLTIDALISPGWYTDFSNKGVDAFRLPWHVVTYRSVSDEWQWVFGVTDLSRQDIRVLPVAGFIYAPPTGNVRLDLVFPKPKVAWRVCQTGKETHWLYVAGELGGGSWAISRADRAYDTVTYRDYRLLSGIESRHKKGRATRLEIGWVFGRAIEYRSNDGNYAPSDAFMLRLSSDY